MLFLLGYTCFLFNIYLPTYLLTTHWLACFFCGLHVSTRLILPLFLFLVCFLSSAFTLLAKEKPCNAIFYPSRNQKKLFFAKNSLKTEKKQKEGAKMKTNEAKNVSRETFSCATKTTLLAWFLTKSENCEKLKQAHNVSRETLNNRQGRAKTKPKFKKTAKNCPKKQKNRTKLKKQVPGKAKFNTNPSKTQKIMLIFTNKREKTRKSDKMSS